MIKMSIIGSVEFRIVDEVWVKPPKVRCTSKWNRGTVTGVNSINNVEIDGMPRHVLDIRRVIDPDSDDENENVDENVPDNEASVARRNPMLDRRPPTWMADFVTE